MQEIEANRRRWDELAERHLHSETYPVQDVVKGASTLRRIELDAFGDVRGKKLLHLQCHIGLDSISWARLGADVTGIDLSAKALETARSLAAECGVRVAFIQADAMDLPLELMGQFDLVAATYGVLCWIPDLVRYFESAAAMLRPDGRLLLIDDHPITEVIDLDTGAFSDHLSYFNKGPVNYRDDNSYAHGTRQLQNVDNWQWPHRLDGILNEISARFGCVAIAEHPFSHYQKMPTLRLAEDGYWHPPREGPPLLLSVMATRPRPSPLV